MVIALAKILEKVYKNCKHYFSKWTNIALLSQYNKEGKEIEIRLARF